jgi:hypothetical protein
MDRATLHGHTINTRTHGVNSTILVLGGREATYQPATALARVAAIIHVFNEEDIVEETVRHLVSEGIEVHAFDNWSTDRSWDLLNRLADARLLKSLSRFPERPTSEFLWREQLEHTARYARTIDADWVLHHDADEIRCSPWPGVSLREAISRVDALGYSAIDFTVIDFRFVEGCEAIRSGFQRGLRYFEFGKRPGHFLQVKCWRNSSNVDLALSGGHDAAFDGRKIFPLKFLMKHYPLRNIDQANQKVFRDRLARTAHERSVRGWHSHYATFESAGVVAPWQAHDLRAWSDLMFHTEHLVQRISGIGIC